MTKWIIGILCLAGLGMGIWTVLTSGRTPPSPPPAAPPSLNPYERGIAATGIVEPVSRSIQVAAPSPGLVTGVFVEVADRVEQDQRLFALDARALQAQRRQAKAAVKVAQARLDRLQAAPRAESVPPARARVASARAELDLAREQYQRTKQLRQENAATREELDRARYRYQGAQAGLEEARARLVELKAGTWQRAIDVARAELAQARAKVHAIQTRIDRLTVQSPITGTVLKRRVEEGEYVQPANTQQAAMVVGDLSRLHVRAHVDEEDAPRLTTGADALARVRGPINKLLQLRMLRIEPFAEPKRELTGVPTELVDTRVVDVVFAVEGEPPVPVYPGQIVDVFIQGRQ